MQSSSFISWREISVTKLDQPPQIRVQPLPVLQHLINSFCNIFVDQIDSAFARLLLADVSMGATMVTEWLDGINVVKPRFVILGPCCDRARMTVLCASQVNNVALVIRKRDADNGVQESCVVDIWASVAVQADTALVIFG